MKLLTDTSVRDRLWTLSGVRLVCHCKLAQRCHGDIIIREFRAMFPDAFDRDDSECAGLREEPASGSESSPDEGAPPKGSGWRGNGEPMIVGVGYISRELCDGQTLASPGRWPLASRRYPDSPLWRSIANKFIAYSNIHGTTELLMQLALGRVESSPFDPDSIRQLKSETLEILAEHGKNWRDAPTIGTTYRSTTGTWISCCVLRRIRRSGVRVGSLARLPRLPALYARKKRWRLPKQMDPLDYLEDQSANDAVWRLNYSSLEEHSDSVLEVSRSSQPRTSLTALRRRSQEEIPKSYGGFFGSAKERETRRSHFCPSPFRWHPWYCCQPPDQST